MVHMVSQSGVQWRRRTPGWHAERRYRSGRTRRRRGGAGRKIIIASSSSSINTRLYDSNNNGGGDEQQQQQQEDGGGGNKYVVIRRAMTERDIAKSVQMKVCVALEEVGMLNPRMYETIKMTSERSEIQAIKLEMAAKHSFNTKPEVSDGIQEETCRFHVYVADKSKDSGVKEGDIVGCVYLKLWQERAFMKTTKVMEVNDNDDEVTSKKEDNRGSFGNLIPWFKQKKEEVQQNSEKDFEQSSNGKSADTTIGYMSCLVTKENERNKGIASSLIRMILKNESLNMSYVYCHVSEKNQIAKNIYDKFDFVTLGIDKKGVDSAGVPGIKNNILLMRSPKLV